MSSMYQAGLVVGATAPEKQTSSKGGGGVWIALGLLVGIYVVIPGKKGWQRALGDGK